MNAKRSDKSFAGAAKIHLWILGAAPQKAHGQNRGGAGRGVVLDPPALASREPERPPVSFARPSRDFGRQYTSAMSKKTARTGGPYPVCSLAVWVEREDPEFFNAIRNTCGVGMLSGRGDGTTLLYPARAAREKFEELAETNPAEASSIFRSLVVRGHVADMKDLKTSANMHGMFVPVAGPGSLAGHDGASVTVTPEPGFKAMEGRSLAVFNVSGFPAKGSVEAPPPGARGKSGLSGRRPRQGLSYSGGALDQGGSSFEKLRSFVHQVAGHTAPGPDYNAYVTAVSASRYLAREGLGEKAAALGNIYNPVVYVVVCCALFDEMSGWDWAPAALSNQEVAHFRALVVGPAPPAWLAAPGDAIRTAVDGARKTVLDKNAQEVLAAVLAAYAQFAGGAIGGMSLAAQGAKPPLRAEELLYANLLGFKLTAAYNGAVESVASPGERRANLMGGFQSMVLEYACLSAAKGVKMLTAPATAAAAPATGREELSVFAGSAWFLRFFPGGVETPALGLAGELRGLEADLAAEKRRLEGAAV